MASKAVSAAVPQIKHDVFINFRGKDTRSNFTSHLQAALKRNGVDAFMDKGLKGGEEISATLSNKISESQVSVVVFSQNYADSRWCLDELVRIMQCKQNNDQTVLPVFLQGVEPTHVRNQTDTFGDAFGRLLQDTQSANKVESWRRALEQASHLSGWASGQTSEDEIVEKILNRIQAILAQLSSNDSYRHFVGIKRVKEVELLLSSPKIRCLGIWGMGGSGKSTLVKKIYGHISKNFDASCFIEDVKEYVEKPKLNHLYRSLLSQLLGKCNQNEGPFIFIHDGIQRQLKRKRVLVILDDVSNASQLVELMRYCSLCCPESKMIATSRDKQVLKNVADKVYEVQKLNNHESLQLLKFHILKQREPTSDQMELLKEALKYTQGLPLALVVLGRNLYDKDITIWKSELAKLSEIPDLEIMKILRTSFDGLEDTEKSIFLDIACLLHGWEKDDVESILDACGFYAVRGIDRLLDKALISISNQRIWMHDLVQQMGQRIAFHEGIKERGKPSRLWRYKDIADLLTKNQENEGVSKIEVISMNLSKGASIKLKSRVFENMTGLRILRFRHAYNKDIRISLPEGLEYLPDGLRYLRWDQYPLPSLPPRFNPENLVGLYIRGSNLRHLWTSKVEPCLSNLKRFELLDSNNLMALPNFKTASKLQKLSVCNCGNLKKIPDSIEHLLELKSITLHGNKNLARFPEISKLTKLESLSLKSFSKIENLPQLPQNLTKLYLSHMKIKELHPSIEEMYQLENLMLCGCEELKSLPDSICKLKNLGKLHLNGCSKLLSLPANLGDLKSLSQLVTDGSPLMGLPTSISRLSSLTKLSCSGYKGDVLPSLQSLVLLRVLYLERSDLKSLPKDIKYNTNLEKVRLFNCKSLILIPELPPSLCYLDASNCTSLKKYTHGSSREEIFFQTMHKNLKLQLRLKFNNCVNLEQDARNEIWKDFWMRLQFVMVPFVEKMYYEPRRSSSKIERSLFAIVCFPRNEVPEWFNYSKIGSSLQVKNKLKRRLHPLRFIFCVVVALPHNLTTCRRRLLVKCDCLTKSGGKFSSGCYYSFVDETVQRQTEHTMLWCKYFGSSQFYFNEATFQFSAVVYYGDDNHGDKDVVAIVKCGVTPVVERACLIKRSEERKSGSEDPEVPPYHISWSQSASYPAGGSSTGKKETIGLQELTLATFFFFLASLFLFLPILFSGRLLGPAF